MKTSWNPRAAVLNGLVATCGLGCGVPARSEAADVYSFPPVLAATADVSQELTDGQLDQLLAPIALYPDWLLAQVLPASTYPFEVVLAAQWVKGHPDPDRSTIDDQTWEPSVKALVNYPEVLQYLSDHAKWTQALGTSFLNQQEDVMDAIQRLRKRAVELGNLVTTPEQEVILDNGTIEILPASPDVIYVPQYDPIIIYQQRVVVRVIVFPIKHRTGRWLDNDCDWHHRWVAVGAGWNKNWRDDDRSWSHERTVVTDRNFRNLRVDNVRRTPETRQTARADDPATKPWAHNQAKAKPTLPQTLRPRTGAEDIRSPKTPPAADKPFSLPAPRVVTRIETAAPTPPRPKAALDVDRGREDVQRVTDRVRRDRPTQADTPRTNETRSQSAWTGVPPTRTATVAPARVSPAPTTPQAAAGPVVGPAREDVRRATDPGRGGRSALTDTPRIEGPRPEPATSRTSPKSVLPVTPAPLPAPAPSVSRERSTPVPSVSREGPARVPSVSREGPARPPSDSPAQAVSPSTDSSSSASRDRTSTSDTTAESKRGRQSLRR